MANEKDDEQFGKKSETGQQGQQPTGQHGQPGETGQQGQSGIGGQQGTTGQTGGGSSSGQTDTKGDTDTLTGQQGSDTSGTSGGGTSGGGQSGSGGFVGSQGSDSDEYLREKGSAGGSDFASKGQGATEGQSEDIETGKTTNRNSDIEGGSGSV